MFLKDEKEMIFLFSVSMKRLSSRFSTLIYVVYLTQNKCSVLFLKLSFFSLQTCTLVKGSGSLFPFVWIQCPDNKQVALFKYIQNQCKTSLFLQITVLSMCPHEILLLLVGNASELLHMKIQRVRATIFLGADKIAHFPLGFTQYLCSQIYLI